MIPRRRPKASLDRALREDAAAARLRADENGEGIEGRAARATRTVVSISAKPRAAASAASAASRAGFSRQLVTWAWLAGVLRTRILPRPIIISSTFMLRTISHSLAGVQPSARRRMAGWGTLMSTNMRAIWWEEVAIASSATARFRE